MRALILFIIGIVFGTGIGLLASGNLKAKDHNHEGHSDTGHDHTATIAWPAGQPTPQLSLQVLPDSPTSRNLHIIADGYDWTPEQVNNDVRAGGGHAHVYLNGTKVARAYGPWIHLDNFPDGPVTVRVTLNANDHAGWTIDNEPIAAQTVTQ